MITFNMKIKKYERFIVIGNHLKVKMIVFGTYHLCLEIVYLIYLEYICYIPTVLKFYFFNIELLEYYFSLVMVNSIYL